MREAAAKGLKLREQFGRGGLSTRQAAQQGVGSGVQRAVNIARGDELPLETWKRVKAYFDRHQGDKDAKGSPSRGYWGDDSNPSAGYVAWLLWGGDAGWEQARRLLSVQNPLLEGREQLWGEDAPSEDTMRRNPGSLKRIPLAEVGRTKRKKGDPDFELALLGRPVGPFQLTDVVVAGEPDPPRKEFDTITHLPTGAMVYKGRASFYGRLTAHEDAKIRLQEFRKHWATLSREEKAALTEGYEYGQLPYPEQMEAMKAFVAGATGYAPRGGNTRKRNPAYSIFDDLPDYEVELPQRRRRSRSPANYGAFQLRSEDGRTASFPTKREAEEWADTFLASGTYFTITNTKTDALTEYEKE